MFRWEAESISPGPGTITIELETIRSANASSRVIRWIGKDLNSDSLVKFRKNTGNVAGWFGSSKDHIENASFDMFFERFQENIAACAN